ncbi:MAG: ComEC/Rec2 family competence protein, partial [Gaiellales bacterium]
PLGVREVLVGPSVVDDAAARPGGAMALVLDMLRDRGVAVRTLRAGDSLALGDARIDVLSPLDSDALESANDRSLVLLVTAPTDDGPRRVLLTGDVQKDAMRALLSRHPDLPADILEAPHHGSAHDDAQAFVRRVDPRVVVQSTGPSRLNDPRWNEIRATRTWLTTASDGAIGVTVRRDGSIDTRTVLGEADR